MSHCFIRQCFIRQCFIRQHVSLVTMLICVAGEDVLVGGEKTGTLRFCGRTQFASGVWCGVELHDKTGKNNGSVAGVTYFKSKPGHGM